MLRQTTRVIVIDAADPEVVLLRGESLIGQIFQCQDLQIKYQGPHIKGQRTQGQDHHIKM